MFLILFLILFSARKEEKLAENVPPKFTKTLQSISANSGQLIRLDTVIDGAEPFDVVWLKNENQLINDNYYKMLRDGNNCTLLILEANIDDNGIYKCIASNKFGQTICQCQVEIKESRENERQSKVQIPESLPKIIDPIKSIAVKEGDSAGFNCKISGVSGK